MEPTYLGEYLLIPVRVSCYISRKDDIKLSTNCYNLNRNKYCLKQPQLQVMPLNLVRKNLILAVAQQLGNRKTNQVAQGQKLS